MTSPPPPTPASLEEDPKYHTKMALHTAELAIERTISVVSATTSQPSSTSHPRFGYTTTYPYTSPNDLPVPPMGMRPPSTEALSYLSTTEPTEILSTPRNPLLAPSSGNLQSTYNKLPSDYFTHSGPVPQPFIRPSLHHTDSYTSTQSSGSAGYRYHNPTQLLYPMQSDGSEYSSTQSIWYPRLHTGGPLPTPNPNIPSLYTRQPLPVRPSSDPNHPLPSASYGYTNTVSHLTPIYPDPHPLMQPQQQHQSRGNVIFRLDESEYRNPLPLSLQPIPAATSSTANLGLRPGYARPGAQNHSFSPPLPLTATGTGRTPFRPSTTTSPLQSRSSYSSESSAEYAIATSPQAPSRPPAIARPAVAGQDTITSTTPKAQVRKGRKRRASKPGEEAPEWESIEDAVQRRRVQNRFAQRAFRARIREQKGSANER